MGSTSKLFRLIFFFLDFSLKFYLFDRESVYKHGRGRQREREKQTFHSAGRQTWGLIPGPGIMT